MTKFWKLLPVLLVAGVLAAVTVGVAATQDIDSAHNFAAEGEEDARGCGEIEVEYGQDGGHVDRVKLSYPGGDSHDGNECEGEFVNVEIHDDLHNILGFCAVTQFPVAASSVQCDIDPVIENDSNPGVEDIDHINLVVTDLN